MKHLELLNDIVLLVRGENLPSNEEIRLMTQEEKIQYEIDQNQIIQIFQQQALLDIYQLRSKVSQLITDLEEIKRATLQKQNYNEPKTIKKERKREFTPFKNDENQHQNIKFYKDQDINQIKNDHNLKYNKINLKSDDNVIIKQNKTSKYEPNLQKNNKVQSATNKKVKNHQNRHPIPYKRQKARIGFFDFSVSRK